MSEIFRSVQGEGRHVGVPSVFLRLARCNLSCRWCDTPYSWDFERFDFEREVRRRSIEELLDELLGAGVDHLVITGGEPLLQQRELEDLLEELDARREGAGVPRLFVEVETNGTVPPTSALSRRVDHFNVSPKLASSGEPESRRLRPRALEVLRETGRADLKLVVGESDFEEADALIDSLGWPRDRVSFMPEATDRETLRARGPLVSAAALRRGVRYTSRLHIELFGGRRGT